MALYSMNIVGSYEQLHVIFFTLKSLWTKSCANIVICFILS